MEEYIMTLPTVALRGMTILPGMVAHFDVSRECSIHAVEEAMMGKQEIFLVTQRDTQVEEPQAEDLYQVGMIAKIKQVIKLQTKVIRVLVEGIERAELAKLQSCHLIWWQRSFVFPRQKRLPETFRKECFGRS